MSCNIMQFMVNLKSRVMIENGVKSSIRKMGAAYYSYLNHPDSSGRTVLPTCFFLIFPLLIRVCSRRVLF